MIAQLKGRIVSQDLAYLVLDVMESLSDICQRAQPVPAWRYWREVTVLTELVVREDLMTLYGFAGERNVPPFACCKPCKGWAQRQLYLS